MTIRRLTAPEWKERKGCWSAVSNVSRFWRANLFDCGMLPFLFLLLSLRLQLTLHVLDVPSKAVAVEIVVTGCFRKGLVLLEGVRIQGTASVCSHEPSIAYPKQTQVTRETHLETIEADDALAMWDVVICENFLSFLRGEKTLFKQGGSSKIAKPITTPSSNWSPTTPVSYLVCTHSVLVMLPLLGINPALSP